MKIRKLPMIILFSAVLSGCAGSNEPTAKIAEKPTQTTLTETEKTTEENITETELPEDISETAETSSEITSEEETDEIPPETGITEITDTDGDDDNIAEKDGPENGSCDTDYTVPDDETLNLLFKDEDHVCCIKYTADGEYIKISRSAFDNFVEYRNSRSVFSESRYNEWVDGLKEYLGDDDEAALSYDEYKAMICDMYGIDADPDYPDDKSVYFSIRGYDDSSENDQPSPADYADAFKYVAVRLNDTDGNIPELKKAAAENGSSCINISFEKQDDKISVFAEFVCDPESYSEFSEQWTILNNEVIS